MLKSLKLKKKFKRTGFITPRPPSTPIWGNFLVGGDKSSKKYSEH